MSSTIIFPVAGLITLICAAIIWRGTSQPSSQRKNSAASIAGLMSITIALNIWGIHMAHAVTAEGINFTLATGAAISTLIVQCIYTVGVIRHGIQGLGLFLLPATALPLFIIPFLPEENMPHWVHTSSLLETSHLLISLMAYAVLTLAALHAFMQLQLDRALKKKRLSTMIQALPPLVSIERHMMAQVKAATILIGTSILTGLVWQWVDYQHFAILNHKVLLATFTLVVLILLQIKRAQASWPAKLASRAVLAAYALLMLAYFGVKLIGSWVS